LGKSSQKRLRIFAGPNGSGKSLLSKALKNPADKRIKIGVFVNADEIEKSIAEKGFLELKTYKISAVTKELQLYILESGMSPAKMKSDKIHTQFKIRSNRILFSGKINSYLASDLASFIRHKLLNAGISFAFETVFSHPSKLEIMREAKEKGYRIYLYFITTEDPQINIDRVKLRVQKGGHPVPEDLISKRYFKTMKLLIAAIKASYRSYLFDNSGEHYELVAFVEPGNIVRITDYDKKIPYWFMKYVYAAKG
jgi:predicted ABC-type ATPase